MTSQLKGEAYHASAQKRLFDIGVSGALLPLVMPATLIGAGAFFAESRVNPFFVQERVGRGGKKMHVLKLRTMPSKENFNDGSNGHDDARASKVGRFLRKTTLDEGPQAIQIFFGQMSAVGPRPLVAPDVEKTMDLLSPPEQREWRYSRTVAKLGWISEFGNASRFLEPQTDEFLLTRVDMDNAYVGNASFDRDIELIKDAIRVGADTIK